MASSVVSARDLERWAKGRAEDKQGTVSMPKDAQKNFNSMTPDFEALSKFEDKVERLEQRREAKNNKLVTDVVINVMGSTAGAGSGCARRPPPRRAAAAPPPPRRRAAPPRRAPELAPAAALSASSTRTAASGPRRWRG